MHRKLLAEQKLSAVGLTDPATVLQLGQLVGAELFLFVEKLPKAKPAAYRIKMIETQTGIALGTPLFTEKSIGEDISPIVQGVKLAIAKMMR